MSTNLEQQLSKVTGEGAGLGYFTAYLRNILPTISEDITEWCKSTDILLSATSLTFYIVVTESGQCPDDFSKVDNKIQAPVSAISDIANPRAGDQSRKLTRSMHMILDGDKKYYFCGEFASPLKTLQGIFNLVDQTPEVKEMFKAQVKRFATIMEDLAKFEQTKQYAKKYEIIWFDEGGPASLSNIMLERIKGNVAKREKVSAEGATP